MLTKLQSIPANSVAIVKYLVEKTQKITEKKFILNFANNSQLLQEVKEEEKASNFLELRQKWAIPTEFPTIDQHKTTGKKYLRVCPVEREYVGHFVIALDNIKEITFEV